MSGSINLNYRALTADDAAAYRELRLHALDTEGKYFSADTEQGHAQSLDE